MWVYPQNLKHICVKCWLLCLKERAKLLAKSSLLLPTDPDRGFCPRNILLPSRWCVSLPIRVSCKCVKPQCGVLRAVPGAHRPCAPSGSAVDTEKTEREKEEDVELTCSRQWLYIYSVFLQAKHMGLFGAGPRCNETSLWGCRRVEGFPVRVSAEPCVELWRHRWRFERCLRRVLRNRGPAVKCTAFVCFPLWT